MRVSALHFQTKEHCSRSALLFGGATTHRSHSRSLSPIRLRLLLALRCKASRKQFSIVFASLSDVNRRASAVGSLVHSTSKRKTHPIGCVFLLEAPPGFEPGNKGFADLCLTTWLWRLIKLRTRCIFTSCPLLERITGLEPATSTLARSRSTK